MRLYFQIALLFTCAIFFSNCDKYEPDYTNGRSAASMNGNLNWIAECFGRHSSHGLTAGMAFSVLNNQGQKRQALSFLNIPLELGDYRVFKSSANSSTAAGYWTRTSDGDVVEDRYLLQDDALGNYISITDYDDESGILKGKFQIEFFIDPDEPKKNQDNPDVILFEEGDFEVTLED